MVPQRDSCHLKRCTLALVPWHRIANESCKRIFSWFSWFVQGLLGRESPPSLGTTQLSQSVYCKKSTSKKHQLLCLHNQLRLIQQCKLAGEQSTLCRIPQHQRLCYKPNRLPVRHIQNVVQGSQSSPYHTCQRFCRPSYICILILALPPGYIIQSIPSECIHNMISIDIRRPDQLRSNQPASIFLCTDT